MLKNAWYILNYHDINWELGPINSGIGGTFSPDMFRNHLHHLKDSFEMVSISDGINRLINNKINIPLLSVWFDDTLAGVRKYAYDILETFDLKGALSVNSDFLLRKDMFWRYKLSYISHTDGLKVLRSRLRKYGYTLNQSVRDFVLDNFSKNILNDINYVYENYSPEYFRKDAFRIFDSVDGINFLLKNGWQIANHSVSHYPITEDSYIDNMKDEFENCDKIIEKYFTINTPYWVAPFDRENNRSNKLLDEFNKISSPDKFLVLVGNKYNTDFQDRIIYRFEVPDVNGKKLVSYLKKF